MVPNASTRLTTTLALSGIVVPASASTETLKEQFRAPVPTSAPVIVTESGKVMFRLPNLITLASAG